MFTTIRPTAAAMVPLGFALFLLPCPRAMSADPEPQAKLAVLALDPSKTSIVYTLSGWPHNARGTFALKHGLIRVDSDTGKMDGIIVVDAASGHSDEGLRDARMRSSILEVKRYPDISFAPQQVLGHGNPEREFQVEVRGIMSLHGAEHNLVVDALVSRVADLVTIHCSFVVPYVEWGLEDPSLLMFRVSKEVNVDVTASAHLSWVSSSPMPTGQSKTQ